MNIIGRQQTSINKLQKCEVGTRSSQNCSMILTKLRHSLLVVFHSVIIDTDSALYKGFYTFTKIRIRVITCTYFLYNYSLMS